MAGVKFEQAMARLEAIVGELEKGDLPLDESLKIFEEGIRLSKNCLRVLEEAERKVDRRSGAGWGWERRQASRDRSSSATLA